MGREEKKMPMEGIRMDAPTEGIRMDVPMEEIRMDVPEKVGYIIEKLEEKGYEAYAVGGCVRDTLLKRSPQDWDVTTSATPEEVKKVFSRTIDTGIQHGTVTVRIQKENFEVTTYRIDGDYSDNRHPDQVEFTKSLKEDLRRRDFTINAMAYNPRRGLVDCFQGMEDLKRGRIRCVGDAKERLREDALRILRGIRFAAQLGFAVDEETAQSMKELAVTLRDISAERIQSELVKLVTSPNPGMLVEGYRLGITGVILPEFDAMMETDQETPHHDCSVGLHTIRSMENIRAEKSLRLTMLMHDMGKPARKTTDEKGVAHFKGHGAVSEKMANDILKRLKFDNETRRRVTKLIHFHDDRLKPEPRAVRRGMNRIGKDLFGDYLEVRRADTLAQSGYKREEKLGDLERVEEIYREICLRRECVSLKNLAISGRDLIESGIQPGKEIGRILEWLLEQVLEQPAWNSREKLMELVLERKESFQREEDSI